MWYYMIWLLSGSLSITFPVALSSVVFFAFFEDVDSVRSFVSTFTWPGPPFHGSSCSLDHRWNVIYWVMFPDHPIWYRFLLWICIFSIKTPAYFSYRTYHNLWVSCLSMCFIVYFVSHQFLIVCHWNPSACHISDS